MKVCDAFGPGFYYAPGTDTCIKIGGYVQFDVNFANPITVSSSVTSGHMFNTEAAVNVTASSMTEYGPLVGFVQFHASGGSSLGSGRPGVTGITPANVDEAWLSLGPLLAGFTWSVYNPTFEPNTGYLWQFTGNNRLNQIRLSWAANGLGLAIAAEDYGTRVPGSISNMPDIVGALNGSWGNMGLHVGAGWGNHLSTNTFGVNGNIRIGLDALAPGDALVIGAAYSGGGDEWIGSFLGPINGADGLNYYSIFGWFNHNFTSQVSASISGGYRNSSAVGNDMNQVIGNLTFKPVSNFSVQGEVAATQGGGAGVRR